MTTFERAVIRNLECPICCSLLTQPKQLACSHTFCEACLTRLLSAQPRYGSIACPVCRHATAVGKDGVPSLPTNFPVKGIVSDVKMRVQHCNNCDDEIGEYYCCNCEYYLCNACHDIHGKLRRNGDHVVVSADDVKQGKVVLKRKVLCQEHTAGKGEHECTDVCITCKKVICIRCMLKHDKQGHRVTSADEYQDSFSRDAESLRKKTEAKISNVMQHVALVDAEKENVIRHGNELSSKIDTTYNEAIKQLKEDKLALDRKCKAETERLCRELDDIKIQDERMVERLENTDFLVINNSQTPLEVNTVAIRESLCEQLTQVLGEDDPSSASVHEVSGRAGKLKYEQNQKLIGANLGNVQYSEWILKADAPLSTPNTTCCMSATPDDRMAVGCSRGERGIEIYSAEGQLQQRVLKGVDIRGIAFLSDGRCAVRDLGTNNVVILNVSLYTQHAQGWEKVDARFETLSWDEGGNGNHTVDRDDHIYVGYRKAKKIQVFTPAGGRPVREIACYGFEPVQIFAMELSKMMVVLTNKNISRTVDPSGDHLIERKSIKKSADCYVYPAVCKDDTILIATVNKQKDRVSIERYTKELKHVANLITDHVIQKSDSGLCYFQEFTSGEIAFCTTDMLYIFHKSVTPVLEVLQ